MTMTKELELENVIATLEQENFQLRARNTRLQRIEEAARVMADQTDEVFWVKSYNHLLEALSK